MVWCGRTKQTGVGSSVVPFSGRCYTCRTPCHDVRSLNELTGFTPTNVRRCRADRCRAALWKRRTNGPRVGRPGEPRPSRATPTGRTVSVQSRAAAIRAVPLQALVADVRAVDATDVPRVSNRRHGNPQGPTSPELMASKRKPTPSRIRYANENPPHTVRFKLKAYEKIRAISKRHGVSFNKAVNIAVDEFDDAAMEQVRAQGDQEGFRRGVEQAHEDARAADHAKLTDIYRADASCPHCAHPLGFAFWLSGPDRTPALIMDARLGQGS